MKKRFNIKMIAKELGISVSTVSKSLNDSNEISKETKERVKNFAKLCDYKPNTIALSLKNKKTKTIGVIIPEIAHDFFSKVASSIESVADQKGYNVIFCFSNEMFEREVKSIESLTENNIDGFIIGLSKETQLKKDFHHLREIINRGYPLVLFDRIVPDIYCNKVIVDDARAAYKAVNMMIEDGYRKIGLLTIPDYVSIGKLRTQGYLDALADAERPADENLICVVDNIQDNHSVEKFFNEQTFDALLCCNEFLAAQALRQAHNRRIKIPEKLGIITFADGFLAQNSYPRLTAIDQHGSKIGKRAAEILIESLEKEETGDSYHTEIIKTSLVKRETTRNIS